MGSNMVLMITCLLAAMALFLLEIVTPSFGLIAAVGIGALLGSIWFAFELSSILGVVILVVYVFLIPAYIVFLVKLLPKTPLGKILFLKKAAKATGDAIPETIRNKEILGAEGIVETTLHPAGSVRIDGQRISVQAQHGMIEAGTTVTVVKIDGASIFVREKQ